MTETNVTFCVTYISIKKQLKVNKQNLEEVNTLIMYSILEIFK